MRHPLAKAFTTLVALIFLYPFGTSVWAARTTTVTQPPEWSSLRMPPPRPIPTPSVPSLPAPLPRPFPPDGQKLFGVTTPSGPYNMAEIEEVKEATGRQPDIVMFTQDWHNHPFDRVLPERILERGMVPMVAWEPWDKQRESPIDRLRGLQPEYALSRILAGDHDERIREWAEGIRDWGWPLFIRFAHEMNGDWYPWGEQANSNRPGEFAEAWRYVHGIFEEVGARNTIWVWSPNIAYQGSTSLAGLYPGDDYVDWVGVVGFFGHTRRPLVTYPTFDEIFGPTIAEIRELTDKPLMITEVGATEVGGFKDEWITQFLHSILEHEEVLGFVWYEVVKETDWRIVSSEGARDAFAEGIADPRYGVETLRRRWVGIPSSQR